MSAQVDEDWWRGTQRSSLQNPHDDHPRVAFQGERGAYGDIAIELLWHSAAIPLPSWSFDDVLKAVHTGKCEYGILPVENTVVGRIHVVCDALATETTLATLHDITIPIRHALLAPPSATLDTMTSVTSHPVALAQCQQFLERHAHMIQHDSYDTAGAARDVAARAQPTEAAIAGIPAARRYHLHVLAEDIQDTPDNVTRFVVIGRAENAGEGRG
jgi:prephenate dehydratase